MKKIIAICGSNQGDKNLTKEVLKIAERVGNLIAEKDGILICGGLGGIMEAAAKGAKEKGGITVGILPYDKSKANKYIDIPLGTNLGFYRNYIIVNSADAIIGICGRWGTLNEISIALALGKPVILITTSKGISELFSKKEVLEYFEEKPYIAETPEQAVDLAFNLIGK
ncbi:MAG: TIGR00725 family protein [Candidatus Omnitrophica bacterium]|nr:TIGR00725 family protein [Candidatus Omnitrophota bacterium]MCM8833398.1 TIGR00725 family protein [Candidatus Omnitrophota bacterium]